ncbi:MAG TPA: hypothetical protein VJB57_02765 [Dehalococcoidia bacterium]|nr:hypothetical protein [Dehalococcoidia bacterium]
MLKKYDVLKEAGTLVDSHLELLQALYEVKKVRMDAKSRLICRCPACRSEQESTLAWIGGFRHEDDTAK